MILKMAHLWLHGSKHSGQQHTLLERRILNSWYAKITVFLSMSSLTVVSFCFCRQYFSQSRLQTQTDTPNTRSLPDPKQKEITAEEMKANLSILIMTSVSQRPRIECNRSADSKFNDHWISSEMSKVKFL